MLDRIARYITDYKLRHDGNAPTIRQIMRACGLASTSTTWLRLRALKAEGRIDIKDGAICVVGATWTPPAQGVTQ